MIGWTKFLDRLPTHDDADQHGHVLARLGNNEVRNCEWNWINRDHPQAKELWHVNGFLEWKPLRTASLGSSGLGEGS